MRKNEIQVFVDGAINFFATVCDEPAQIASPHLLENLDGNILEFSGIIGITGSYSGNVIFTASSSMLKEVLEQYNGVEFRDELLIDLVGEIANTISGNAREVLGSNFNISPPILARGTEQEIKTAEGLQTYCIPIVWNEMRANLIVAIAE